MVQPFTPAPFIAKWSPVELSERATSQEHFDIIKARRKFLPRFRACHAYIFLPSFL